MTVDGFKPTYNESKWKYCAMVSYKTVFLDSVFCSTSFIIANGTSIYCLQY